MSLLNEEDYEDLPSDDREAFAKLQGIAWQRVREEGEDSDGDPPARVALDYMTEVAALAHQFDVPGINYHLESNSGWVSNYREFVRAVQYQLVQIRVQRSRREQKNSLTISGPGRERIQHHLEQLKVEISASSIDEKRKRALLDKIADFEVELAKKRFNLAAAMAVVALIAATASDSAGALEGAMKLATSISVAIGNEKAEDDERQLALPKREPLKAIPDMRPSHQVSKNIAFDVEDEVPF